VEPQDRLSPLTEFILGAVIVFGPMIIIDIPARKNGPVDEFWAFIVAALLSLVGLACHHFSTPLMLFLLAVGYVVHLIYLSGPTVTLDVLPWAGFLVGRWDTTREGIVLIIIGAGTAIAGGWRWGEWEAAAATEPLSLWLTPPVTALFVFVLTLATYMVGSTIAQTDRLNAASLQASWQAEREVRARIEARAANAATNTRLEISRELHDILAHSLSLIVVQANGAQLSVAEHPELASETLERIADVASDALSEIRAIIGRLRSSEVSMESEKMNPQPGLENIESLVEASAGKVTLVSNGIRPTTSAMTELTAYRVVQEALTNCRKHAGDDAKAVVTLNYNSSCIEIDITNDDPSHTSVETTPMKNLTKGQPGHGLVGMFERVAAVGGQLEVGPLPGGGFRVHAWLPATLTDDRDRIRHSNEEQRKEDG
jgi:signal transduction histidine kinase